MRTKRAKEAPKIVPLTEEIAEELTDMNMSYKSSLSDTLTQNDIAKKIDKFIETLPRKEKLIMKLNIYHNKKYHEIAEILNIPKGTVSSYMKRAKEKIRDGLKDL